MSLIIRSVPRGGIQNRELALVERDFTGLYFGGGITPTDIDGFLDFGDRLFILIEGKAPGVLLKGGQRKALERLTDASASESRRHACLLLVETDVTYTSSKGHVVVDYAKCTLREYYKDGKWSMQETPMNCRQACDALLKIERESRLRRVS